MPIYSVKSSHLILFSYLLKVPLRNFAWFTLDSSGAAFESIAIFSLIPCEPLKTHLKITKDIGTWSHFIRWENKRSGIKQTIVIFISQLVCKIREFNEIQRQFSTMFMFLNWLFSIVSLGKLWLQFNKVELYIIKSTFTLIRTQNACWKEILELWISACVCFKVIWQ